jgi:hypothetical protein
MNTTVLGIILTGTILGANGFLIFESSQTQMEDLNKQFNNVMNETTGFLNHSWNIAQKFQDPNYNYDPSELGNYTIPETPSAINANDR